MIEADFEEKVEAEFNKMEEGVVEAGDNDANESAPPQGAGRVSVKG